MYDCAIQHVSLTYKFTGKERDSESGLDNFGARYYSNGLGRFITRDWAAKATAVPYAHFDDPQTLNQYSYVRNLPSTRFDADGHDVVLGNATDKDRKATAWRITKNLTAQERKMFKAGVNQQTHETELQLKPNANLEGQHTKAFTRLAAEVNDHDHTATVKLQSVTVDGEVKSVAVDYGGGATFNQGNGNSLVLLAPEGNLNPSPAEDPAGGDQTEPLSEVQTAALDTCRLRPTPCQARARKIICFVKGTTSRKPVCKQAAYAYFSLTKFTFCGSMLL